MQITGYVVRETEAAVAFIATENMVDNVKPLWVPKKKIANRVEQDSKSVEVKTAQDGLRVGFPTVLEIDESWAAKVGIVAN